MVGSIDLRSFLFYFVLLVGKRDIMGERGNDRGKAVCLGRQGEVEGTGVWMPTNLALGGWEAEGMNQAELIPTQLPRLFCVCAWGKCCLVTAVVLGGKRRREFRQGDMNAAHHLQGNCLVRVSFILQASDSSLPGLARITGRWSQAERFESSLVRERGNIKWGNGCCCHKRGVNNGCPVCPTSTPNTQQQV